jgi:hypothetical protein
MYKIENYSIDQALSKDYIHKVYLQDEEHVLLNLKVKRYKAGKSKDEINKRIKKEIKKTENHYNWSEEKKEFAKKVSKYSKDSAFEERKLQEDYANDLKLLEEYFKTINELEQSKPIDKDKIAEIDYCLAPLYEKKSALEDELNNYNSIIKDLNDNSCLSYFELKTIFGENFEPKSDILKKLEEALKYSSKNNISKLIKKYLSFESSEDIISAYESDRRAIKRNFEEIGHYKDLMERAFLEKNEALRRISDLMLKKDEIILCNDSFNKKKLKLGKIEELVLYKIN